MGKRACPLVVPEAVISSPDLGLEATVAVQAMVIEQLREANARLVAANAEQASLIATLNARVAELERRLGKDSSNSSRPPSSGFGGAAVHDGWSPYWRYPKASHALCAAHLVRELEGAAELPGQGWAAELAEWFSIACATTTSARDAGTDRLEAAVLAGLCGRYDDILAKGRAGNPPPSRPLIHGCGDGGVHGGLPRKEGSW